MKRKNIQNINLRLEKKDKRQKNFDRKNFVAGFPPFLRGIESILQPILVFQNENISSKNIFIYHPQETTLPEIELANTISKGLKYVKEEIKKGGDIDDFSLFILFSWKIGQNHIEEIAKMRAARILWSKLMRQFNPKNYKTFALKIYFDVRNENSDTEKTLNSLTAILGGAQFLHSDKIKLQKYLQKETFISKTIDPWAGSLKLEKLTIEIAKKTWKLLQ